MRAMLYILNKVSYTVTDAMSAIDKISSFMSQTPTQSPSILKFSKAMVEKKKRKKRR